eukprot:comp17055_c0_seq1/m.15791 comp17055_c0_seq1/g.15791  ORF comp17055_c0_seq1/g.15791 comp17055_c0_seq1/m.15791 type:complete len:483 (-) comp17055_c0_seq1:540-1988(-)
MFRGLSCVRAFLFLGVPVRLGAQKAYIPDRTVQKATLHALSRLVCPVALYPATITRPFCSAPTPPSQHHIQASTSKMADEKVEEVPVNDHNMEGDEPKPMETSKEVDAEKKEDEPAQKETMEVGEEGDSTEGRKKAKLTNDEPKAMETGESVGTEKKEEALQKDDVVVAEPRDPLEVRRKAEERLASYGYHFNEKGQLRHKETGEPYQFEVKKGDKAYNQKIYEEVGETIEHYVYSLLETDGGLKRVDIPVDAESTEPKGFIFVSDGVETNPHRLMIIMHGTGVVRAGQWARRIIVNDCLENGTQLPYILRAKKEGYAVVVTNTNLNRAPIPGTEKMGRVRGSETAEDHAVYVWDKFVQPSKAKEVAIVAHSYGGVATVHLLSKRGDEVRDRVKAIAFTDSVHGMRQNALASWMKPRCRNWVTSDKELDTFIRKAADCELVSAGTPTHEYTSPKAFNSVFEYFASKMTPLAPVSHTADSTSQ